MNSRIIKLNLIICLLVVSFGLSIINTKAEVSFKKTSKNIIDLGYGVTLENINGTSKSEFNSTTTKDDRYQEIYTAVVPSSSPAKIVQWSYVSNGENRWANVTLDIIAKDYEAKNPGKKVLVAVNNWLSETTSANAGELDSVQISDGLNYRIHDYQGIDGGTFHPQYGHIARPYFLGFDKNGKDFYFYENFQDGTCYTNNMYLSIYNGVGNDLDKLNIEVSKINELPSDNEVAIFFSNYDGPAIKDSSVKVIKLKGKVLRHDKLNTVNVDRDCFALGEVVGEVDTIDCDYNNVDYYTYYLVSKNSEFNKLDLIGKDVVCQYELKPEYQNVLGATTYYYRFVREGKKYLDGFGAWNEINCEVHPRTVFFSDKDGNLGLSVIDGRQKQSIGMDYQDMANFFVSEYNAYQAFNYDGGGSSAMIIADGRGFKTVNSPSDGNMRRVGNATLVVVDKEPYIATINDINENLLEFSLTNVSENVESVFATLNGSTKEFNDGKVLFDNLELNTNYEIKLSYKLKNDSNIHLGSILKASTCGKLAKVDSCMIDGIDQSSAYANIVIDDSDNLFSIATINCGPFTTTIKNLEEEVFINGLKSSTEYELIIEVESLIEEGIVNKTTYKTSFKTDKAKYPEDIILNCDKLSLKIGETSRIKITTVPGDLYTDYTYKSSDENIITVSTSGKVTAVSEGTAVVTVTTKEGVKKEISFTVTKETSETPDAPSKKGCKKKNVINTLLFTNLLSIIYIIFKKRK